MAIALAPPPTSAPLDPDLGMRIIAMSMAEQEARFRLIGAMQRNDQAALQIAMHDVEREDRVNGAELKRIVASVGWPTYTRVGREAGHMAWLIVQHQDADPEFQKHCLRLMEPLVAKGEVSGTDFAYLADRVAINTGGMQIYGTQMSLVNGKAVPTRLRDPHRVDERRRQVGLGPLDEYIRLIEQMYAPPKS
ncbi:MAG TPA: hypothetical protein DIS87_02170 [Armatimonadetes bacterium]|nr:hypothetical protein [Armatimonadota bacterium]